MDVLSRTIWGARTALEVVILALIISIVIGVPLGLISGYVGGWLDRILVLINDALFAFPYLLLAIVAAFLLSDTIDSGIVRRRSRSRSSTSRSTSESCERRRCRREKPPTSSAAPSHGAKPRTIIRRYLFGNVVQSVPVIGTLQRRPTPS